MTVHTWHTRPELLEAYSAGGLDALAAASVEQHLVRCEECRIAIREFVDGHELRRAWLGVRDAVEHPEQPLLVRAARRLGLSDAHAVLLAATVSLRTAWVMSSVLALTFATAAAHLSGDLALWPFLVVAPLVPLLGVAVSYGHSDDSWEGLVVATPFGRGRLIMVRTLAVLATTLPLTFLVGLTLPGPAWVAAAWLGPALALVPVLLALSSFAGPRTAAGIVSIGWVAFVLPSVRLVPATWPVEAQQQLALACLALAATGVLAVRAGRPARIGALL